MSTINSSLHKLKVERSVTQQERYDTIVNNVFKTSILFIDEFEVTDIADASILTRIIKSLHHNKTTLLFTSNRNPHDIYKGGLNWNRFQPEFGDTIHDLCNVREILSDCDYRVNKGVAEGVSCGETGETGKRVLYTETKDKYWNHFINKSDAVEGATDVPIRDLTRTIAVLNAATCQSGHIARFFANDVIGINATFSGQCYVALASYFDCIIISGLEKVESRDDKRRLTLLVDVMYEKKKVLLFDGASDAFDAMFGDECPTNECRDEVSAAPSAGYSMRQDKNITVLGEGGSSGRLTTMIGENLEWSATGRFGASLLDVTKGDFSKFGYERCKSRLGEMRREEWLKEARVGEGFKDVLRSLI
jgi:predicted ATPase